MMYGISGSKPGGFERRSRTRSQAETQQLLGHEAARAGSRICCGGLAEHGPDHLSSPKNSLAPLLATITA